MMNSVGAEKDPYLQAYIQARMKNHVEEVKLQKVLANLEVGRRIKKIMLNMELFEDRKTAHKLKKEASDLETKKRKAMHKFMTSNRAKGGFNALAAKSGFYSISNFDKNNSSAYSVTDMNRDAITTAPTSGINRRGIFPVTKGNTRNTSPNHCGMQPPSALCTAAPTPVTSSNNVCNLADSMNGRIAGTGNGASQNCHVIISINDAKNPSARSRRRSNSFREMAAPASGPTTALGFHRRDNSPMQQQHQLGAPHSSGPASRRPEHCSLQHPTVSRRASGVPHMPTTNHIVQNGSRQGVLDLESANHAVGVATPATIPMHRLRRAATDVRSVRTLPNLPITSSTTGALATRPRTTGYSNLWPGDPNAIQSVRRDRKKPEEMLSLVKNGEEARRMVRDTPVSCSRNCSKPDLLLELGRSYSDLPSLLPAIEKARHDMARREAASRDAVPQEEQEDFLEEVAKAMPVSQIQYGALRSLGGVRRNSVIV
ncbi:hypothetical protein ElyMa_001697200 [Elysia marginata]|uniref:REM-1 domain-containing protein n=1 Tax=Elysia marginata TaxID=1093978 RepID=A0AAV4JSQ7_9GAST|nr:hypothetical protein ElyMa_001697200 [Elysia marginata]